MTRAGVNCGQLGWLTPPPPPPPTCDNHRLFTSRPSNYAPLNNSFVASASSVPSVSGSEQLVDLGSKKKKKDELVDPKLLADPDSCFCEYKGVDIHHKIYDSESLVQSINVQNETVSQQINKLCLPMILLHGFGASVFSWKKVMKPLAEATGSKVLAFDRPAFGLTSRLNLSGHLSSGGAGDTKPLNVYSMAFSVLATLHFMGLLKAEKAILVGHSAGCLVAVNTYFEAPERVAALILIAPAIFAPRTTPKSKENQSRQDNQMKEEKSSVGKNPIFGLYKSLSKIIKYIARGITEMTKQMKDMANSLYRKLVSAILRSSLAIMLVRMAIEKFGTAAVRNAWYDPSQVSEHVITGYTKPLRVKDWDRALVEFTAAMFLDEESKTKPSLSSKLHEISCPVLIVTGDSDRLVPSWNAERLSRVIPGASFEVIKQCGHLPHEEKVEEFISIVENFLRRVGADSSEQCLQPVM